MCLAIQWMQPGQAPPNCPPGLEYLASVDQLLVHQKTELLEGGFEICCIYRPLVTVTVAQKTRLHSIYVSGVTEWRYVGKSVES